MKMFLSGLKENLLKGIAFVLFHSGLLRPVNRFVNRFQLKKRKNETSRFPFIGKRESRSVRILIYHRVNDEKDPFFPATPVKVFEKQMEYLSSRFKVLPLEEAAERIKRRDVPENAVVITFDDGYRDNYTNAFPIVKKYVIPMTIFLATDAIGSGRVLWHDRVFSAFRETRESFLNAFCENSQVLPLRTLEEKLSSQGTVLTFLRSLEEGERLLWIDRLVEKLKVVERHDATELMLTWDQVKTMSGGGVHFGSHTVTHPILSRLPGERVKKEIWDSKAVIEGHLGTSVKTFAYPNGRRGDFNEITKKCLSEAGYTCALTTIWGRNESDRDLFEMRREIPWEEYLPTFALKLNWYDFFYSETH